MTSMPLAFRRFETPSACAFQLASLFAIMLPVLVPETRMPWLLLWSLVLPDTVEAVLDRRLMPGANGPWYGWPAVVTVFPATVMLLLPLT